MTFANVVSFGHTIIVNAIVAILFTTPTNVNVVAVTTVLHRHPLYEIHTPMTHDNNNMFFWYESKRSITCAFAGLESSLKYQINMFGGTANAFV